ncbi:MULTISPECIES: Holliday junction branch migration protein RuvA [Sutcliffiella]|uniref:Holliday junction branch migration complex subunit RuvA n=1 Tax=Sutcliffiella cohnii TaxID=33932 RepID=A0A223KTP4_9BACI|nr:MULTISPECIES: Holliday junction branch migration protein RuvA [Sutcliffiella]AST92714.1 Holliday junction DNA helicase RuvA [Sutcliffiella cohnii]MED4016384.1 Holliday junction branch migration protein RuvA [Sutcliffiella cohnii]WBL13963.1 Holliday junction branch migration protein RuvA [Sutcliffiella sp. NC1]
MIEFLKGYIDYVSPEYIVLNVNNVGYQIHTPNPFIYQVREEKVVTIYTYQHVREDVLALYGFQTREEKNLFLKLLNVTGIGPKGALAIIATGEPTQVIHAIENEDEKYLTKFPGVGKKTARQIILDLKGKLQDVVPEAFPSLFEPDINVATSSSNTAFEEAVEALKVLGYGDREIKKITPTLSKETLTTDQYVKRALQLLLQ